MLIYTQQAMFRSTMKTLSFSAKNWVDKAVLNIGIKSSAHIILTVDTMAIRIPLPSGQVPRTFYRGHSQDPTISESTTK